MLEFISLIIALLIFIAELRRNSRIERFALVRTMLKDKIDLNEKIAADLKLKYPKDENAGKGHRNNVNNIYKPKLRELDGNSFRYLSGFFRRTIHIKGIKGFSELRTYKELWESIVKDEILEDEELKKILKLDDNSDG